MNSPTHSLKYTHAHTSARAHTHTHTHTLGWPKSSFRFFCKTIWKTPNELSIQPYIYIIDICRYIYTDTHMYICVYGLVMYQIPGPGDKILNLMF